jgi:hypothetical protein
MLRSNDCHRIRKDAFQGQGFVGQDQLADAAAQMGWDSY